MENLRTKEVFIMYPGQDSWRLFRNDSISMHKDAWPLFLAEAKISEFLSSLNVHGLK